MCSDAPKNLASAKQINYVKAKTMCSDALKNLARFKQIKYVQEKKRCAAMHQKI